MGCFTDKDKQTLQGVLRRASSEGKPSAAAVPGDGTAQSAVALALLKTIQFITNTQSKDEHPGQHQQNLLSVPDIPWDSGAASDGVVGGRTWCNRGSRAWRTGRSANRRGNRWRHRWAYKGLRPRVPGRGRRQEIVQRDYGQESGWWLPLRRLGARPQGGVDPGRADRDGLPAAAAAARPVNHSAHRHTGARRQRPGAAAAPASGGQAAGVPVRASSRHRVVRERTWPGRSPVRAVTSRPRPQRAAALWRAVLGFCAIQVGVAAAVDESPNTYGMASPSRQRQP